MSKKAKILVVDTGAFIKNVPLWEHGEKLVTVHETINEIKDPQTRQHVEAFPIAINFQQPDPKSVKYITDFTKKTGDYHSLSLTDIKILALTYEMEVEANGSEHLRSEPLKRIVNTQVTIPINTIQEEEETEESLQDSSKMDTNDKESEEKGKEREENGEESEEDDEGWTTVTKSRRRQENLKITEDMESCDTRSVATSTASRRSRDTWMPDMPAGFYVPSNDEQSTEDDDEQGWITPDNIDDYKNGKLKMPWDNNSFFDQEEDENDVQPEVACITGDFAMQNVLRHIGLLVFGVDGKLIKAARNYVLRCFGCFTVTPDMNKLFCPRCGHRTLKRVSMTIDADGTQRIWISHRRLKIRGTKYNLPKPRGGQHAIMPLLTADQRFPAQWAKRSKNKDVMHPDYVAGSSPFNVRDVYSRAASHGYNGNYANQGIKGQLRHAKIWKPRTKRSKVVKK